MESNIDLKYDYYDYMIMIIMWALGKTLVNATFFIKNIENDSRSSVHSKAKEVFT